MVDLPWGEQSYQEVLQSIHFLECLYCCHRLRLALPIDHPPPIDVVEIPPDEESEGLLQYQWEEDDIEGEIEGANTNNKDSPRSV